MSIKYEINEVKQRQNSVKRFFFFNMRKYKKRRNHLDIRFEYEKKDTRHTA